MSVLLASQKKSDVFTTHPTSVTYVNYHIPKDFMRPSLPIALKLNYFPHNTREITEEKLFYFLIMTN